jgi:hypothetical protein
MSESPPMIWNLAEISGQDDLVGDATAASVTIKPTQVKAPVQR